MDQDLTQGTPLTSLMHWDRNGELHSEDFERLLARLQTQEIHAQKQEATVQVRASTCKARVQQGGSPIGRERDPVLGSAWGIRP